MLSTRLLLTLAWLVPWAAPAAAPGEASRGTAWVQMTAAGSEVRLVSAVPSCPDIAVDGVARRTRERAAPTEAFPNRVCVATIRASDRNVAALGVSLRTLSKRPDRLVIVGDSGCRMKGGVYQNCHNLAAWPFPRIAALAAARKPELIIHLGDYYYRENPCPAWATTACAGSPHGDRWETWNAELFDAAAPLLAAAPWVFARGNHETCDRGGGGWSRLLDAGPATGGCIPHSATFSVDLGGVVLWVVDSSDVDDFLPSRAKTAAFAARVAPALAGPRPAPAWIVTHKPPWNASRFGDLVADGLVNATERAALKGRDLSAVDLVLSGHVHNFSSVSFREARPTQLVVGTGGDLLDMEDTPPPTSGSTDIDGLPADIFTMGRFGYFVLDRHGAAWTGHFYDLRDKAAATCVLHRRSLACTAVDPR
jgi:hypothetical protein